MYNKALAVGHAKNRAPLKRSVRRNVMITASNAFRLGKKATQSRIIKVGARKATLHESKKEN